MDKKLIIISLILILTTLGAVGAYEYWSWITRKPFNIRYAYTPYADSALVYVAVEKGFFKEENLNVSLTKFLSGVMMLQAAAAGDVDGGVAAIVPELQAFKEGINLRLAGPVSYYDKDHDPGAFIVAVNSSIQSVGDLKGKTFGIRSNEALTMLMIRVALMRYGLTLDDIKTVVIASPLAQIEALIAGNLDVIYSAEPFLTQALSTGKVRIIYHPYTELLPDHKWQMVSSFFLKGFIDQNKDVVDAFIRAYKKAVDWINANPEETREIIANWTGMDSALAKKITLHAYSKEIDQEGLRGIINLMWQYGYLESDIALEDILYQG
jgi:NitT/TauT family transport system substrate-binding protein